MNEVPSLQGAVGEGHHLFTDPDLFYFQYREQIERWTKLGFSASLAVSNYLATLSDTVASISDSWTFWTGLVGKYKCLMICPPSIDVKVTPWVGVGLGWHPTAVMPDKKGSTGSAFVGIHVAPGHSGGSVVRLALDSVSPPAPREYKSSEPWPRYLEITADSNWWGDLDGYASQLISPLSDLYQDYAAALEHSTDEWAGQSQLGLAGG